MRHLLFLLFTSPLALSNCLEEPIEFKLEDPNGKVYSYQDFHVPVVTIWYEGKNTKEDNRILKDLLKSHPDFNDDSGKYKDTYKSLGIANYQETSIPNFLISMVIKSEIEKTGVRILADKDTCYSGNGTTNNCPEGTRKPWFENGKSNILIGVDGKKLKFYQGKLHAEKFKNLLTTILDAKLLGKNFCEISNLKELNESFQL